MGVCLGSNKDIKSTLSLTGFSCIDNDIQGLNYDHLWMQ